MTDKIFISIASYRDPELLPTIRDAIKRAEQPENLVFAIAWQHSPEDEWDNFKEFEGDDRFRIIDIPHETSKGTCWARNLAQQSYRGEAYFMQIDSHHRFEKNWDAKCKAMISKLQKNGYEKPLLTAYLPSYDPSDDPGKRVKEVWQLNFDRFTPEGVIFMLPATMQNTDKKELPVPTRFFSAHFLFTLGQWATEVPYDPNLYFHGEEISLAVRSYTHGYDLFIPNKIVAWHEYTRKGRIRHWDENKKWEKLNSDSLLRAKKLLGVDGIKNDIKFGEYGFGKERTIADYEKYSGIRFKDRSVQDYTIRNFAPPNPIYSSEDSYEASFISRFRHCLDVHITSIPEDEEWDYWAVIFEDNDGKEIYRQDADKHEIIHLKNERKEKGHEWYNLWREFETKVIPDRAIVWPFRLIGDQSEWGPRIQIDIPKIG